MTLLQSTVKQGNFFFKYRGQFPVLLFVISIPFMYLTDYNSISDQTQQNILLLATST